MVEPTLGAPLPKVKSSQTEKSLQYDHTQAVFRTKPPAAGPRAPTASCAARRTWPAAGLASVGRRTAPANRSSPPAQITHRSFVVQNDFVAQHGQHPYSRQQIASLSRCAPLSKECNMVISDNTTFESTVRQLESRLPPGWRIEPRHGRGSANAELRFTSSEGRSRTVPVEIKRRLDPRAARPARAARGPNKPRPQPSMLCPNWSSLFTIPDNKFIESCDRVRMTISRS